MKSSTRKACPFDKKPCMEDGCAVWSDTAGICSFACIPDLLKKDAVPGKQEKPPHKPDLEPKPSGGFRVALFD